MSGEGLIKGDAIRIRATEHPDDEWCAGVVAVASDSKKTPQSVLIMLVAGGMVRASGGLIGGALPVSVDYNAETVTGLDGQEYEMEVR